MLTDSFYQVSRAAPGRKIGRILAAGTSLLLAAALGFFVGLMVDKCPETPQTPLALATLPAKTAIEMHLTFISRPSATPLTYLTPTGTHSPLPSPTHTPSSIPPTSTPLPPTATSTPRPFFKGPFPIGHSAGGRDIYAYRLGLGSSARALIGGIHGGYEPNTTILMSQTLQYLTAYPKMIPPSVTLYIVPLTNPDGFVTGRDTLEGRMNANDIDLNRNWDYRWQMTATHQYRPVKAGAYPFSEPETAALRDFILERQIENAIVYHSEFGCIFSAADVTHTATLQLAEMMSRVTGYPHLVEGIPGQITTGDAIDWMSTQGITAIEVELTNHQDVEWERNLQGILAFLNWNEEN